MKALQSNVTETKERLQTLKSGVINHDSCINALESFCSAFKMDNKYMKAKLEDLESRSKRQNIIIVRISEGAEKGRPAEFIAELIPAREGTLQNGGKFNLSENPPKVYLDSPI